MEFDQEGITTGVKINKIYYSQKIRGKPSGFWHNKMAI